ESIGFELVFRLALLVLYDPIARYRLGESGMPRSFPNDLERSGDERLRARLRRLGTATANLLRAGGRRRFRLGAGADAQKDDDESCFQGMSCFCQGHAASVPSSPNVTHRSLLVEAGHRSTAHLPDLRLATMSPWILQIKLD